MSDQIKLGDLYESTHLMRRGWNYMMVLQAHETGYKATGEVLKLKEGHSLLVVDTHGPVHFVCLYRGQLIMVRDDAFHASVFI